MELIHVALYKGVPGYLENPRTSLLWETSGLKDLVRTKKAWYLDTHFCQYGLEYKKGTRLLMWGVPENCIKLKKCKATKAGGIRDVQGATISRCHLEARGSVKTPASRAHPVCSRTGEKHLRLRGVGANPQEFKTKITQVV